MQLRPYLECIEIFNPLPPIILVELDSRFTRIFVLNFHYLP